ncbi:MAG: glutamate synthase domain-containing protein 2 [Psychromonas sp.]|jgi:glutamate synthase domain-containing protein 2|uniref:FMN-binding glutamate synthase family protein n=1 Tax=Psychromonas sp. TaxID=1884585 RepID=UPI0039E2CBEC
MLKKYFVLVAGLLVVMVCLLSLFWPALLWLLMIILPVTLLGIFDMRQTKHALWINFPVVGHLRWITEYIRPYIRQYLFESETDGVPINRMFRSVIYQRAKGALDTIPYGTKVDTQRVGYEWIGHSLAALHVNHVMADSRVTIGGPDCLQPYSASIFNISAMSFGALSNNAILALNKGAKIGGFAHNTGEGSVSPYHLSHAGDLIWQIGTGYFGCRDQQGNFSAENFIKIALLDNVKMIEIKLSQGAKPGHGGILPGDKNSIEIAQIRGVIAGQTVNSPATHSAFSTPLEMMFFIQKLRRLCAAKPIGFKLCVGNKSEFFALCKAMIQTAIKPDFITVDGGEGGTGAAPLEFSNSVGMPLREGLSFVCDTLIGFGLKDEIKVIASGKIFTGFHLVKNIALGADLCNSARGMMIALGCVQSLICNTNRCPTGIATQDPSLVNGLVVEDKATRVAAFHHKTVQAAMQIINAAGLESPSQLNRAHIYRRTSQTAILRFDEIYPYPAKSSFVAANYPKNVAREMLESTAESFLPEHSVVKSSAGLTALD